MPVLQERPPVVRRRPKMVWEQDDQATEAEAEIAANSQQTKLDVRLPCSLWGNIVAVPIAPPSLGTRPHPKRDRPPLDSPQPEVLGIDDYFHRSWPPHPVPVKPRPQSAAKTRGPIATLNDEVLRNQVVVRPRLSAHLPQPVESVPTAEDYASARYNQWLSKALTSKGKKKKKGTAMPLVPAKDVTLESDARVTISPARTGPLEKARRTRKQEYETRTLELQLLQKEVNVRRLCGDRRWLARNEAVCRLQRAARVFLSRRRSRWRRLEAHQKAKELSQMKKKEREKRDAQLASVTQHWAYVERQWLAAATLQRVGRGMQGRVDMRYKVFTLRNLQWVALSRACIVLQAVARAWHSGQLVLARADERTLLHIPRAHEAAAAIQRGWRAKCARRRVALKKRRLAQKQTAVVLMGKTTTGHRQMRYHCWRAFATHKSTLRALEDLRRMKEAKATELLATNVSRLMSRAWARLVGLGPLRAKRAGQVDGLLSSNIAIFRHRIFRSWRKCCRRRKQQREADLLAMRSNMLVVRRTWKKLAVYATTRRAWRRKVEVAERILSSTRVTYLRLIFDRLQQRTQWAAKRCRVVELEAKANMATVRRRYHDLWKHTMQRRAKQERASALAARNHMDYLRQAFDRFRLRIRRLRQQQLARGLEERSRRTLARSRFTDLQLFAAVAAGRRRRQLEALGTLTTRTTTMHLRLSYTRLQLRTRQQRAVRAVLQLERGALARLAERYVRKWVEWSEATVRNRCCVAVQAAWRGYLGREKASRQRGKVMLGVLHPVGRGYLSRLALGGAHRAVCREVAAREIQRWWRVSRRRPVRCPDEALAACIASGVAIGLAAYPGDLPLMLLSMVAPPSCHAVHLLLQSTIQDTSPDDSPRSPPSPPTSMVTSLRDPFTVLVPEDEPLPSLRLLAFLAQRDTSAFMLSEAMVLGNHTFPALSMLTMSLLKSSALHALCDAATSPTGNEARTVQHDAAARIQRRWRQHASRTTYNTLRRCREEEYQTLRQEGAVELLQPVGRGALVRGQVGFVYQKRMAAVLAFHANSVLLHFRLAWSRWTRWHISRSTILSRRHSVRSFTKSRASGARRAKVSASTIRRLAVLEKDTARSLLARYWRYLRCLKHMRLLPPIASASTRLQRHSQRCAIWTSAA